jgi:ankyrin repeat protein
MDARKEDISLAYPQTCDWFFETSQFRQWYRRDNIQNHNGVLWVKGHPGTGKSTLMKHTLMHLEGKFSDTHIIAAHFFNARGHYSERTPLSMLRSLLYQLLEKEPISYKRFITLFRKKKQKFDTDWEWRESELKNFLLSEIQHYHSKPLCVLVDALDECEEEHVRDVVKFLEDLSLKANDVKVTLNICLSSRHYPHIRMQRHLELVLEKTGAHDEDIAIYTRNNLAIRDKDIEKEFLEKASGVFMWAVLVINLLNKAFDEGQIEAMQETLHDVPGDLEQVFESLLIKNNSDKSETILMLQFVLLARRLVTPEELYFGTLAVSTKNTLAWDKSKITQDDIRRRITNSSRGLIEIRKSEENNVQFIHKSVNDFLIRNQRLQKLDPGLKVNALGSSHERLRSCCMAYIMMVPFQPAMSRNQIKTLGTSYPFLEYASVYLLEHTEEAEKQQIGQADFLQFLMENPSSLEKIRLFHNSFEKCPGSGCARGVSLLHMLAFHGYTKLTRALLNKKFDVNAQGGVHGHALQAAIAEDKEEIVKLLLKEGADVNAHGGYYGNALQAAAARGNKEIVDLLLKEGANINAKGGIFGNALQAAMEANNNEVVILLLSEGANVNAQGGVWGSSLQSAIHGGQPEIAKLLLSEGADANAQGGFFGNALCAAIEKPDEEIAKLLLSKGADVNAQGGPYGNALCATVVENQADVMELLLEKGADVNAQGGPYGNALCAAVIKDEADVVKVLLEKGADVNSKTVLYGNALQAATILRNENIMELLVEAGADTNPPETLFNPGPQAVIVPKTEGQFFEMILKQRVPVSTDAQKALLNILETTDTTFEQTMEILFKNSIEANNQWIYDGSICLALLKNHSEDAVKLVERGANPYSYFRGFLLSLPFAMLCDAEEAVAVLLDNGADINAPMFYTGAEVKAKMSESHTYQFLAWVVLGMFTTLPIILWSHFSEIF